MKLSSVALCYKILNMKNENLVGDNIRGLREKEGITQEGLALKSGLSQGYINQLENGKRRYTQKTLELIADALSVPVIELFKDTSQRADVPKLGAIQILEKKKSHKKEFALLVRELPHHIVEHYLTLLRLEKELLNRKNPTQ